MTKYDINSLNQTELHHQGCILRFTLTSVIRSKKKNQIYIDRLLLVAAPEKMFPVSITTL